MYAHSVKNPEIIHYFINSSHEGVNPETRKPMQYRRIVYLCIRAANTTPSKRTRDMSKVTCKNCLRELQKRRSFSKAVNEMMPSRPIATATAGVIE